MDNGLYYKFFEDSDSAMALMYRNGSILKANKKFVNLFESLSRLQVNDSGDSTGSALPLLVSDIPNISHISQFWSNLLPVINGTKTSVVFEIPFHFFGDNGDIHHWFNAHVWRVEDGNSKTPVMANNSGRPQQDWLIGIYLEDYTLVRQEEKKLLDGMESAEKAMEAKDQFLANMSHEIRTPIQTIIGTTELLQDTRLDHEQNEYSRQVKFSAEVLLTLVNDILDYSKIEAGKMELEHIEFDLEQAVEQAVEMITLEAHKKELSIVTVIPLEADIIIKGDPGKFRQIVINLVKNAVKFTKEGGITVSLALTNLNGREALRVSVADTGIGIREEARARLFSTFMQADASNTRRFGGTGLGLVISRNLVELMKGRIEMIPNEGGGSIFRFDIPLEPSEKKIAPLPPPERDGKLRILIVDDRDEERNISSIYLRDLGYSDITLAESGEAALVIMRSAAKAGKVFHICLIDMIMPVMDGWRLAAEIHNDETIKQADLILMVPHGFMGADTKMTLLRWFKGYINKPVKRRSLAETIDAVLNEPQELEALTDPKDVADAAILNEANRGNQIPAQGAAPDKSVLPGKSALSGKSALPILIAEDHPVNQKLFAAILEKLG
ncbi:MAG: ATP-binding protein, partial [Treponema sp.]|nr:ATP-binding protein [Treponema sp.]